MAVEAAENDDKSYVVQLRLTIISILSALLCAVPCKLHAQNQLTPFVENQRTWSYPQFKYQKALGYNSITFETPQSLQNEVQFWIQIYTKYTTQQGLFHISGAVDQVIGDIDLTDVFANPKWSAIRKEKEAEILIRRKRQRIANQHGITNIKHIRLQMGLKDRMENAIFNSGRYMPMMEEIFKKQDLPIELTRLVFVESSFNIQAQSRVGASGLWQIMPIIGKKFKYLDANHDLRNDPRSATLLAAKILKQNYQILKSWPLAVTSYNFGVGSMLKVQKKLKSKDDQYILNSADLNKYIGFASRNFYATFLAALYVESHANIYYGEPFMIAAPQAVNQFMLTQKIKYDDLILKYKISADDFKLLNVHIRGKHMKKGKWLPKGTLIHIPINKVATLDTPE